MTSKSDAIEYVPFRVSTLRGDQKIDFDAYLKINEKFILYVRRGDSFEGDRIKKLKEKKTKQMFLRPEEEQQYRQYIERNIEMAYDKNSGKSIETRSEIIQGAQQNCAEEVFENPGNAASYQEAKTSIDRYVNFLLDENGAFRTIMQIENSDASIAHHGVTVATLSTMLMNKIQFDPKQIPLIALGGLLHDFAHYSNGIQIKRPLSQFSQEELKTYKLHPGNGAQAIMDKRHIDQLIVKIILQHEECIDGSGFPNGFREKDIEPGAVIVGTANALDRLIAFEGMSRTEACKHLMVNKIGLYPLDYIRYLSEAVKDL
ncbi:MAG: hypothetical protein RJB66_1567 [Pseudomonadota bacterium]|jgi:HD-GYP domain-containing protein (c-di-GMP phosphodiesterase class II)